MTYQVAHHIRADGSMIEDSVSYQRFVLEMLATRVVIGGAPERVVAGLLAGGSFLSRLGVGERPVPQYGDWDEGRILTSSGSSHDLLGTVRLAAGLGGNGAPRAWRQAHDEVAWYASEGTPANLNGAIVDGGSVGSGMARSSRGPLTVWLKTGSGASHGHADLTSTSILFEDQWLVGDPGTGTYNGDLEVRNYFRTSIAHAVLRLNDEDQLVPHRAFRWANTARGRIGPPIRLGALTVMWGVHDAYRRLPGRTRVARVVVAAEDSVTVGDWVEGEPRDYRLSIPLAPDVVWNNPDLELPDGRRLRLDQPGTAVAARGSDVPFDGWWSSTYGSFVPATRLEFRGSTEQPVVWAVAIPSAAYHAIDAQSIVIDGGHVQIRFLNDRVQITVVRANQMQQEWLRLPA